MDKEIVSKKDEQNEFLKKCEIVRQKEEKVLETDEYISWLGDFTKVHNSFHDDDWAPSEISDEDFEKVQDLYLLYSVIEDYASANYISSIPSETYDYYCIMYEGIGYNIGVDFCKRVEIENEEDFIDFKDIQNNKIREEAVVKNEKLKILSDQIKDLVINQNIPMWAIGAVIQSTLEELEINNHS